MKVVLSLCGITMLLAFLRCQRSEYCPRLVDWACVVVVVVVVVGVGVAEIVIIFVVLIAAVILVAVSAFLPCGLSLLRLLRCLVSSDVVACGF